MTSNDTQNTKSRLKRFAVFLFIGSWILLFIWAFRPVRIGFRYAIFHIIGFSVGLAGFNVPETISLEQFKPTTKMVPVSEHLLTEPKFPVLEFHGHIFPSYKGDLIADMKKCKNPIFVDLAIWTRNINDYNKLKSKYPENKLFHFPAWNYDRLKENNNQTGIQQMADDLEAMAKAGIKGIKMWKNLGLGVKRPDGSFYTIDDEAFEPLWQVVEKYDLLVAMHSFDPPAFFDLINSKNERFEELAHHPEWTFAKGPTFDELMAQRNRLFEKHRNIRFVSLHFAELAHDLKRAGEFLDQHPNVSIDTAQRIDELGRQPKAARDFFIKYQDRILYGTDGVPDYEKVRIYWRFFETDDEYFDYFPPHKPRKGFWKISGISLPDTVLKKLYYQNALKLLKISESDFLAAQR
ncbi:MAG: amidohydrolase family protein [Leptonema sp. (in: Bacteria)]|nr:amidohydrolase family protein [Leptonema sp. (in: bacteria)]